MYILKKLKKCNDFLKQFTRKKMTEFVPHSLYMLNPPVRVYIDLLLGF